MKRRQPKSLVLIGERWRYAREQFCKMPQNGRMDWRGFIAVTELLESFTRLEDWTSLQQLASVGYGVPYEKVTGWQRDRIGAQMRRLAEYGVFGYEASRGWRGRCRIYLLPAPAEEQAADLWITDGRQAESAGLPADEDRPVQRGRQASSARKTSRRVGDSEECSEKYSERESTLPKDREEREEQPESVESRLFFALRENGNAQKEEELSRETSAAVSAVRAAGFSSDAIDAFVRGVAERGCVWPSEFRKLASPSALGGALPPESPNGDMPGRGFGVYECSLGRGCDNGNVWDAQKNGVVRCGCMTSERNSANE